MTSMVVLGAVVAWLAGLTWALWRVYVLAVKTPHQNIRDDARKRQPVVVFMEDRKKESA